MRNSLDAIFQQLLTALHVSEKRHRAVRDNASDNSDWVIYDAEGDVISGIIKWRRNLEPLRAEIIESGAIDENDFPLLSIQMPSSSAISCGVPIFRKTVDWSTLDYGITIPIADREAFFSALGHTVAPGTSCGVSIVIDGNDHTVFEASIRHSMIDSLSVVQILYPQDSETAAELKRIFINTFDYCRRERSLHGDTARVEIPSGMEEYISIIVSDSPRLIKFVCSPSCESGVLEESSAFEEIDILEETGALKEAGVLKESNFLEEIGALEETSVLEESVAKPSSITLLGKEYHLTALNDMFMIICETMLLHNPYVMAAMDKDADFNAQRKRFSYIQSDIDANGKRLSNGLWVETDMEHHDIRNNSFQLLNKCGFSADELRLDTELPAIETSAEAKANISMEIAEAI